MAVLGSGRGAQALTVLLQAFQFRGQLWFFAKITQISDVFVFLKFRKVGKFAASIERPKTKNASASPWPPDQGLRLWTPVIGSHYRAHHGAGPTRFCGLEPPLVVGPYGTYIAYSKLYKEQQGIVYEVAIFRQTL